MVTIGVLNLQGDVREHVAALGEVGADSRLVKRPDDLQGVSGLILPGGESTTLSMLLTSTGLFEAISELLDAGLPVLGTCAGLVLLARQVLDGRPDQRSFGAVDAAVRRNGFGRQVASFETELEFGEGPPLPAVFIRAPYVVRVGGRSTYWRRCATVGWRRRQRLHPRSRWSRWSSRRRCCARGVCWPPVFIPS